MSEKRFSDLNDLQAIIEELEQKIDEQQATIEVLKARIHELSWQLDEERKLQKLDALHRIKNLEDSK